MGARAGRPGTLFNNQSEQGAEKSRRHFECVRRCEKRPFLLQVRKLVFMAGSSSLYGRGVDRPRRSEAGKEKTYYSSLEELQAAHKIIFSPEPSCSYIGEPARDYVFHRVDQVPFRETVPISSIWN
jgi:hypothetical protein